MWSVFQLLAALGIYVAFLGYGYKQEEIISFKGSGDESFEYAGYLQLRESGINVIVGFVLMLIFEGVRGNVWCKFQLQKQYITSGLLQVTAKYCTTQAMVLGVPFPVAKLGKSPKKVILMLISLLFTGKMSHGIRAWFQVGLIIVGTALVCRDVGESLWPPMAKRFILAALVCDGIVGGTQQGMKDVFVDMKCKQRFFEMQFFTNLYMFVAATVFTFVKDENKPAREFLATYPGVETDINHLLILSAFGQSCIFYIISRFDPVVCTTLTTVRKVLSVLLSMLAKNHPFTSLGGCGIFLVVTGILCEIQEGMTMHAMKKKKRNKTA